MAKTDRDFLFDDFGGFKPPPEPRPPPTVADMGEPLVPFGESRDALLALRAALEISQRRQNEIVMLPILLLDDTPQGPWAEWPKHGLSELGGALRVLGATMQEEARKIREAFGRAAPVIRDAIRRRQKE